MAQNDFGAIPLREAGPNDEAFIYRLYASARAEEMAALLNPQRATLGQRVPRIFTDATDQHGRVDPSHP